MAVTAFVIALATAIGIQSAQSPTPFAYGSSCSALAGVGVSRATVTFTLRFPTGTFDPRRPAQQTADSVPPFRDLPEFCRAALTAVSPSNTFRGVEVWIPTHSWNGKLMLVGRDRTGASLNLNGMAAALSDGFVAASLDNGSAPASTPRTANQDAITTGIHDATLSLTLLLEAYFGSGPRWIYWKGCGAGARDGLLTAEQYPADFDGILAGGLSDAVASTAATVRAPAAIALAAFRARGGKVVLHDRAADAAAATLPLRENSSVRLFVVPAGPSCPNEDDGRAAALARALEAWVERGTPPDRIVIPAPGAGQNTRTRLLCPFPLTPVYAGAGNRDDAASFACRSSDQ